MQSVIETHAYLAAAKDAGMSAEEQQMVVDLIAAIWKPVKSCRDAAGPVSYG